MNLEFQVGKLTTAVETLTVEVRALRMDVSEIKLFREKVLGACLAISAVVSFAVSIAERIWAKQ